MFISCLSQAQEKDIVKLGIVGSTSESNFVVDYVTVLPIFISSTAIDDYSTPVVSAITGGRNNESKIANCVPPTFINGPLVVLDASCGKNDGAITIIPMSGVPPYMYSIDGGTTYYNGGNLGYTFMELAPGVYKLRIKDASGCESEVAERRIKIIYAGPKFSTSILNANSCSGKGAISIIPKSGVSPFMYSIDGGETYLAGADSGITFSNLIAESYFLRVKDFGECESDMVRANVDLVSLPAAIEIKKNISICAGDTYKLPWDSTATTSGIYSHAIPFAGMNCDSLIRIVNLTIKPSPIEMATAVDICNGESFVLPWGARADTTGIYRDTIRYENASCDSLIRTVSVTVKPKAFKKTFEASINTGEKYVFSSGATTSSSGLYYDTLRYASTSCDSLIKTINLFVKPAAIQTVADVSICSGSFYKLPSGKTINTSGVYRDTIRVEKGYDSLIATVNLYVKRIARMNRTISFCQGESYQLPSGKVVKEQGNYYDTLRYASGCDSSILSAHVIVKLLPKINIEKSNDITCKTRNSSLAASGGASYFWKEPIPVNAANSATIVVSPDVSTLYKVTVSGYNGCTAEDSIQVNVNKQGEEALYLVPNAFTPNMDGKNDCFSPGVLWRDVTGFNFNIYNRWGVLVFHTSNPSACWDGTYKGTPLGPDAYVYQITAKTFCGTNIFRKGTVLLIR